MIGLAGLLGAMIGTFMPWLDQARIAPFSLLPWAYIFFVVILPSTLVLCAIFFSVAALTRSFALTYAAAIAFFVAEALLNLYAKLETGTWVALADPSARLTVAAETRYWTVAELNTNIPLGLLPQNRLLWLTVALLALLLTLRRFRLDLAEQAPFRFKRRTHGNATAQRTPQPAIQKITPVLSFSPRASFAQFVSQLKMDLSCVFKSPLIYIILALGITSMIGEFQNNVSRLARNAALPADESDAPLSALRYAGVHPAGWPLVLRRIDPSRTRIRHWRDCQRVAFPRLAHDPFEDHGDVPGGQRADARGSAHLDGAADSGRLHQLRAGPVSAIRIHLQRYLLLHAVHPGRGHSGDLAEQMAGACC